MGTDGHDPGYVSGSLVCGVVPAVVLNSALSGGDYPYCGTFRLRGVPRQKKEASPRESTLWGLYLMGVYD